MVLTYPLCSSVKKMIWVPSRHQVWHKVGAQQSLLKQNERLQVLDLISMDAPDIGKVKMVHPGNS